MSKFRFKFESVKKVKETFEKKAQKELAQIDLIIEKHNILRQKLEDEINDLRNSAYKKRMNISELQFLGGYDTVLKQQVQMQSEVIMQLEKKREKKIEEVVIKTKEKKILNQLEETYRENFYKDINMSELKNFDEIAVQNFNKAKK
ncbi:MAG: flagellar FliJ family protein [Ignavibacteriaceae bacterium]|jgi:flagellar FliJ protein|nr:flagellar FliJ family protein [Ignavibacterium sp.]MCC6253443.1 flagellar FliJ family protein [Ignavibacteriaceae bacterium]HMN22851.1 flagellar FliJ family protein [Ignavibacteriaceae bacterium]HRN26997.1 flagellar FliJ family protein [Ignavibacteriaceae bacterium]HRP91987.1 flagellar FliJ family protein [Ignavibacteriaceae bacterium]